MGIFDFLKKKTSVTVSQSPQTPSVRVEAVETEKAKTCDDGEETLESKICQAIPSHAGLYPHEILMLEYASSYKTSENNFQNFWKWEYLVLDPQSVLDSLFKRGFICYEDIGSALRHLTVSDLKNMLSKIGEKTTGKKDELINRLLNVYNPDDLEKELTVRHYALTDKGKEEVKHNEYVLYLHRHRYMSVWDMNHRLFRDNPSHLRYRDIIWGYFNEQSGEHFKNFDFGLYRNVRLNMHDFLVEEGKLKSALEILIEVISFDLSGLGNKCPPIVMGEHQLLREAKCQSRMTNLFKTEDKAEVTLPPGVVRYFEHLYNELKMDSKEFIKYTYEIFAEVRIHKRVFNSDECANIILSEIGLENRKVTNSCEVAKKRLMQQFGIHSFSE